MGKKQSKRMTIHQKNKISRKIREHQKKLRQGRIKPKHSGKNRDSNDIPNECPFKSDMLNQLESHKKKIEDDKIRAKEQRKAEVEKKRKMSMGQLANDAASRARAFEMLDKGSKKTNFETDKNYQARSNRETSAKSYFREFRKVVEGSDVILEVIDARDPLGCRCFPIEQMILAKHPNKKIILVLNKIDLVPRESVEAWLKYLRNFYPTIAFKCSTQQQKNHRSAKVQEYKDIMKGVNNSSKKMNKSEVYGASTLIQLLKQYSLNQGIKTAITVGIIGFPNVGKSSIINSLKRTKSVGVGNTPGFTKVSQEIILDKKVKLLDSPGVVFAANGGEITTGMVLRNVIKLEQVIDPVPPVDEILKKCQKEKLIIKYKIPTFDTVQQFLTEIAKKRGKLLKGGMPDLDTAARMILQDWNFGKIKYYTLPPTEQFEKDTHVGAEVVKEFGDRFNPESAMLDEADVISKLKSGRDSKFMAVQSDESLLQKGWEGYEDLLAEFEKGMTLDDEDESDEYAIESEDEETNVKMTKKAVKSGSELNPQANKDLKKQLKNDKKKAKKVIEEESDDEENYDFAELVDEEDDEETDSE
eukprot:TRINITY_DN3498_c0_g1_i1.p1 TRINITY_DN3498_c0_g1~~TRINITY_DN3498_c0_g1_i1.p1  ORF type:complete len:585 (-),score=352.53 TRINITY_DN3498_c0_g1_i1:118-1872(-)